MKILCGLGNPGRQYEQNRHNVGFLALDLLAARWKLGFSSHKFDAELAHGTFAGEKVLLIKPQTFMNASGQSLGGAARFYKVPPADVIVVHDELDLPYAKPRVVGRRDVRAAALRHRQTDGAGGERARDRSRAGRLQRGRARHPVRAPRARRRDLRKLDA
jgi:hypothetical protein